MSQKKLLRKRNLDEVAEDIVDQTAPPLKRVKREKLTKADKCNLRQKSDTIM